MRSDTELFKDKIEISLDGRQIFYLFFGGAVLASLVFVLGVMVGRRVEARAHVDNQPATSAALDPLAALDELARRPVAMAEEDLAFPAALAGGVQQPLGELDRVLASTTPVPAAVARPASAAPASPAKPGDDGARPARAEVTEPEHTEQRADKKQPARFTLQLSSFQDRAEANAFFEKLRGAGQDPYVTESQVDGQTWYRVRLGHYLSYDAAVEAKLDFEKRQHIIAYVTRL
ncbi:MAG TPA: SPOR domain-containing protein [Haliangium sp.]|nr:SPOR domain-containing protein [Haliangium sp.]